MVGMKTCSNSEIAAWQMQFERGSITANSKARRLYSVRAVHNESGFNPSPYLRIIS
jgi:hypothetical protein